MDPEWGQRPVGPGTGPDDQPPAPVALSPSVDLDLAIPRPDRLHRRAVPQGGAELPRHPLVRGIAPGRHRDPALWLEESVDVVGESKGRPAAHDLVGVQRLVTDARRIHAARVVGQGNGADPGSKVEPTGLEHDLLARILLQLAPGAKGVFGELDIRRGVIREPDDARMVLRLPPNMPQLELLQPQHLGAGALGQPVRRRAAEASKAENDILEVRFISLFR